MSEPHGRRQAPVVRRDDPSPASERFYDYKVYRIGLRDTMYDMVETMQDSKYDMVETMQDFKYDMVETMQDFNCSLQKP